MTKKKKKKIRMIVFWENKVFGRVISEEKRPFDISAEEEIIKNMEMNSN